MTKVTVEVSARHIHISRKDLDILYGQGYELTVYKPLSIPSQFAANETLAVKTESGQFEEVRILGPIRSKTQVEISRTDAYRLKLDPPVRGSGDLEGSAKAALVGPKGKIELEEGVIIANRHIHAKPEDVEKLGLKDGQTVSVKISGERGATFHNVLVRVNPEFEWYMHVDTDEGNAAGMGRAAEGEIISE